METKVIWIFVSALLAVYLFGLLPILLAAVAVTIYKLMKKN